MFVCMQITMHVYTTYMHGGHGKTFTYKIRNGRTRQEIMTRNHQMCWNMTEHDKKRQHIRNTKAETDMTQKCTKKHATQKQEKSQTSTNKKLDPDPGATPIPLRNSRPSADLRNFLSYRQGVSPAMYAAI